MIVINCIEYKILLASLQVYFLIGLSVMKWYSNKLELWPHDLPQCWWKGCVWNMACRVSCRMCSFAITNRAVQEIHKNHSNYQVKSLTSKWYSRQQSSSKCYTRSVHVQLCSEQGHILSISKSEKNPSLFLFTASNVNKLMANDKLAWRSGERDQFQVIIQPIWLSHKI
jgi:hypothetical protein